jgi:hypothetical protein
MMEITMQRFNRAGALGALLLAGAFLVYGYYELVLWPAAGFPTTDIQVILAGAPTLRIGHWLTGSSSSRPPGWRSS